MPLDIGLCDAPSMLTSVPLRGSDEMSRLIGRVKRNPREFNRQLTKKRLNMSLAKPDTSQKEQANHRARGIGAHERLCVFVIEQGEITVE